LHHFASANEGIDQDDAVRQAADRAAEPLLVAIKRCCGDFAGALAVDTGA